VTERILDLPWKGNPEEGIGKGSALACGPQRTFHTCSMGERAVCQPVMTQISRRDKEKVRKKKEGGFRGVGRTEQKGVAWGVGPFRGWCPKVKNLKETAA